MYKVRFTLPRFEISVPVFLSKIFILMVKVLFGFSDPVQYLKVLPSEDNSLPGDGKLVISKSQLSGIGC